MIDHDAIAKLYAERSDSLDASSYDVPGLCKRIVELEAALCGLMKAVPARPDDFPWILEAWDIARKALEGR